MCRADALVRKDRRINVTDIRLDSKIKDEDITNYNLRVVLYGCETLSLTLREERRLRVFEDRVLRRIFERKRDEVTGEWRKLHNEELNDCILHRILFG